MKKIILMFFVSFLFLNVKALSYKGCDYSTVARMKSIVSNINLSYDYKIENNEAIFTVTINNLTDDIYFYDYVTKREYYYSDSNNGEVSISGYTNESGSFKFYSNNSNCKNITLGTKYYKFPSYNRYYQDELCKDIPNYSLCQKWVKVNYSRSEFEELVSEYKKKPEEIIKPEEKIEYKKTIFDKIVELYIKYYNYILGGIIVICLPIIIIYNKKNKFDL